MAGTHGKEDPLLAHLADLRQALCSALAAAVPPRSGEDRPDRADPPATAGNHTLFERLLFVRMSQLCGALPEFADEGTCDTGATGLDRRMSPLGPLLVPAVNRAFTDRPEALQAALGAAKQALRAESLRAPLAAAAPEILGRVYQTGLARDARRRARKSSGSYYTPAHLCTDLIDRTVIAHWPHRPTTGYLSIVDPACGGGALLLSAYRALLHLQPTDGPRQILERSIFGVDIDPCAVELTRLGLTLMMWRRSAPAGDALVPDIASNIRCGDALDPGASEAGRPPTGIDWQSDFPARVTDGFDVVIGNPPWGQKSLKTDPQRKRRLNARYPSSRGIFDWFRPFVELGVARTRAGGYFGMVLPDIVLLKNYESSRRHLLQQLSITDIDWRGMAFADATIDAVTVVGRRVQAPPEHRVRVRIERRSYTRTHHLRQADFLHNPRATFNLHLTDDKRAILDSLAHFPRLGDHFEVHEGVHSGNIRRELFVSEALDESCRPLYFGRAELRRYHLRWAGHYLRLSAVPTRRSKARYANLGRPEWYARRKLLVRRTSDAIHAAVDEHRRFASNNFFVAFPRSPDVPLDLDGLCAVLNSPLLTWLFRVVEPRTGRAFAELKIKHLVALPLPDLQPADALARLCELGRARRLAAMADDPAETETETETEQASRPSPEPEPTTRSARALEIEIDRTVRHVFGLAEVALPEL